MAGTGPMPMSRGSTPALAHPSRRARGVRPRALACSADVNTTAAPPSVIPDEEPAVMMPSPNAVGSFRRLSIVASGRGCSSRSTTTLCPFTVTVTGAISRAKCPPSAAAFAFRWLSSANRSDASRVMAYCFARISAVSPMMRFDSGH